MPRVTPAARASADAARTSSRAPTRFAHDHRHCAQRRITPARRDHRPVGTPHATGTRHPARTAYPRPFASTRTLRSRDSEQTRTRRRAPATGSGSCAPARPPPPATPRTRPAPHPFAGARDQRRASPSRTCGGTVATTTVIPSSRAATTAPHRSGGTRRTTASRSSSTPASAAAPRAERASRDRRPRPTRRRRWRPRRVSSATVVDPEPGPPSTATVLPRCTPPAGSRSPSSPATGSRRSLAATNGCAPTATARSRARASSSRSGSERGVGTIASEHSLIRQTYRTYVRSGNPRPQAQMHSYAAATSGPRSPVRLRAASGPPDLRLISVSSRVGGSLRPCRR